MEELFKSGGKLHWIKNLYLRYRYGAGCCDTFNFCHFLAPRLLKQIKCFKRHLERGGGYPMDTTWKEWHKELDEIIWAFEFIVNGEELVDDMEKNKSNNERQQKGFELFGKRFRDLWI